MKTTTKVKVCFLAEAAITKCE